MAALAAALSSWRLGDRQVFAQPSLESLTRQLIERPDSISGQVDEAFRRHPIRHLQERPYLHLLLIVDHAETLVADSAPDRNAVDAFARALEALSASPRTLTVVILRRDFYPKLIEAMPSLAELCAGNGRLEVFAPGREEIARIIQDPATSAGLEFEQDPESEAYLDEVLRDAAVGQPDALPLLQHTLETLYGSKADHGLLTFAAYRNVGGLEGAIAHRAEEVFATLPVEVQQALDSVLSQLVVTQPDNDAVSGRRVFRGALPETTHKMIDAFIDARLFVADELSGDRRGFGVAHEALLRQWPRAVTWVQDNRRLLQARARLGQATERWRQEGRRSDHLLNSGQPLIEAQEAARRFPAEIDTDEREFLTASSNSAHRRRIVRHAAIGLLAVSALASATLAVLATQARNNAEKRRRETIQLVDFMTVEVVAKLEPTGNLDVLDSIGREALSAVGNDSLQDLNLDELIQRSRALVIVGRSLDAGGSRQEALQAFEAAHRAALVAENRARHSPTAINETGQTAYWLGNYYRSRGRLDDAERYWTLYFDASARLMKKENDNPKWMMETSYAYTNFAALFADRSAHDKAIAFNEESVKLKQQAINIDKSNLEYRKDLIDTLSWITTSEEEIGNLRDASEGHKKQIAEARRLIQVTQGANAWKRWLANALVRSATLAEEIGNHQQSVSQIEESLSIFSKITHAERSNVDWLRDMAFAHMRAGDILGGNGSKLAAAHYAAAMSIAEKLAADRDPPKEWYRLLAMIRFRYAPYIRDPMASNASANSSLNAMKTQCRQHQGDADCVNALAEMLVDEGVRLSGQGDKLSSKRAWEDAILLLSVNRALLSKPRITRTWTDAHVALGRGQEVAKEISWLRTIGYRKQRVRAP
jgi:eukaryotic-like serine/threonine-protein kinase